MLTYLNIKSKANSLFIVFIMASLVFLHIPLTPLTIRRAGGLESSSSSYLNAMDIDGKPALTGSRGNDYRQRHQAWIEFASINKAATNEIDPDLLPALLGVAFAAWLTDVGLEFEAMPQSDMVSRK